MTFDYLIGGVKFRIHSDTPLQNDGHTELFLQFHDDPEIEVYIHAVDTLPVPGGHLLDTSWETRLYLDGDDIWQETYDRKDGTAMFRSRFTPGSSRVDFWVLRDYLTYSRRPLVFWAAIDLPCLLLSKDILTLHSASVLHDDKVILFAAPSQTGKSTQARLWDRFRGARQLNGDKNCIGIRQGRAMALGTPLSGTSGICSPYEAPLRAIVLLRQSPVNRVTRLSGANTLASLLNNSFAHQGVPDNLFRAANVFLQILQDIPVYCLECTPDENAVCALENALEGVC